MVEMRGQNPGPAAAPPKCVVRLPAPSLPVPIHTPKHGKLLPPQYSIRTNNGSVACNASSARQISYTGEVGVAISPAQSTWPASAVLTQPKAAKASEMLCAQALNAANDALLAGYNPSRVAISPTSSTCSKCRWRESW